MIRNGTAARALPALLILAGCNTFDVENGSSVILTADQRVVVTKSNPDLPREVTFPRREKDGTSSTYTEEVGSTVQRYVCAEPNPDAIKAQAASAAASGGYAGVTAGLSGGFAESAASIGLRTGAIQILRDLEYRSCEALMNGVVGAPAYSRIIAGIGPTTLGLVAIEGLTRAPVAPAANITTNAPATFSNATFSPGQNGKSGPSGSNNTGVNTPPGTPGKPAAPGKTGPAEDKSNAADPKKGSAEDKQALAGDDATSPTVDPKQVTLVAAKDGLIGIGVKKTSGDAAATAPGLAGQKPSGDTPKKLSGGANPTAPGDSGRPKPPASNDSPPAISGDVARAVVKIVCIAGVATPSVTRGETAQEAIATCNGL